MKWLGHVYRMENTSIPKQWLFGELSSGHQFQGRLKLRNKDGCKDTMKHLEIDPKSCERMGWDWVTWRIAVRARATLQEEMLRVELEEKHDRTKQRMRQTTAVSNVDTFKCCYCSRPCHSNIGRLSHERSCSKGNRHLWSSGKTSRAKIIA